MSFTVRFLPCTLLLVIAGCGGGAPDAPTLGPVFGKVMVDGAPLGGLTVEFHPTGETKGPMSAGVTNADGTFSIKTSTGGKGAVVGEHVVLIKCPWRLEGRRGKNAPLTADGVGSSESGEVPTGPATAADECSIAAKFEDIDSTPFKETVTEEGLTDLVFNVTSE